MQSLLYYTREFCLFFFLLFVSSVVYAGELTRVESFGNNPGNLKMYVYSPDSLADTENAPLLVVMHGCVQNAGSSDKLTGWSELADKYGFRIVYPQQKLSNNPVSCFCWYNKNDIEKGKGEVESIHQMILYAKDHYTVDSTKVFVTGLSAGAAMSVALMAVYPGDFNAGAVFSGGPYKTATHFWTAAMAMLGWRIKSPQKWGDLVRQQNPDYKGKYPRLVVYHGSIDVVVHKRNARELVKQWTNLHQIQINTQVETKRYLHRKTIDRYEYYGSDTVPDIIYYKIKNMRHALLINPGKCVQCGGKRGAFSADRNFYSSFWTLVDFRLIPAPDIKGEKVVQAGAQHIVYQIEGDRHLAYKWFFPKGCQIICGEGTNSVTVNWGQRAGNVDVYTGRGDFFQAYKTLKVVFGSP